MVWKINIKRDKEENRASGVFMNAVNQQLPFKNILIFFQFYYFSPQELRACQQTVIIYIVLKLMTAYYRYNRKNATQKV